MRRRDNERHWLDWLDPVGGLNDSFIVSMLKLYLLCVVVVGLPVGIIALVVWALS